MVVLSMIDNVSKISNLMLMVGKYCKINVKTRLIYFDFASSSEYQGLQNTKSSVLELIRARVCKVPTVRRAAQLGRVGMPSDNLATQFSAGRQGLFGRRRLLRNSISVSFGASVQHGWCPGERALQLYLQQFVPAAALSAVFSTTAVRL